MKKYLLMFTALLLITACGNKTATLDKDASAEEAQEVNEELDEFIEENNVQLDDDGFFVETTDPLEAGNKNNGIVVYDNEGEYFIVKEWYLNKDTDDDGFNFIDFEGYEVTYAIALIENVEEEDLIGVFGEVENNTEDEIQFNDSFIFVTDTKDQTELEHGMQINKPNTKSKFFNYATLEYGTPDSFTVEILPPFRDGESELIDVGEPIELEFTKE